MGWLANNPPMTGCAFADGPIQVRTDACHPTAPLQIAPPNNDHGLRTTKANSSASPVWGMPHDFSPAMPAISVHRRDKSPFGRKAAGGLGRGPCARLWPRVLTGPPVVNPMTFPARIGIMHATCGRADRRVRRHCLRWGSGLLPAIRWGRKNRIHACIAGSIARG